MAGFNYGGGSGDGTNWSSERGDEPTPGGGERGHSGDHKQDNTSDTSGNLNVTITQMKPGDSYDTPWGKVIMNASGQLTMNGIVMTLENTSLVTYGDSLWRVLTSLVKSIASPKKGISENRSMKIAVDIILDVQSGNLPAGYWLNNGRVMTRVREERTSRRGAKGNDGTYYVTVDKEIPWLTDAYNLGVKMRAEAAVAQAEAKAKAKAQAEIKNRGAVTKILPGGINLSNNSTSLSNPLPGSMINKERTNGHTGTSSGTLIKDTVTVQDAVKFTTSFYKEVTEKYGVKASQLAQELSKAAKGKKIRSVDDALMAFNKHKNVLDKKYNKADLLAISRALESIDRAEISARLAKFSKVFNFIGNTFDVYDVASEFATAIRTGKWRPLFVTLETLAVGRSASALIAVAFSFLTGSALGVLGFSLIMAIVGSFIDDAFIEKANKLIGL